MAERGQIKGGLLDGPLAFDNAISREAAKIKGIDSEVAGDPDILLAPDLEAGNMVAKQLTFLANADSAGLVLGARVPVILTSRADSVRARIASCAVAALAAHARRHARRCSSAERRAAHERPRAGPQRGLVEPQVLRLRASGRRSVGARRAGTDRRHRQLAEARRARRLRHGRSPIRTLPAARARRARRARGAGRLAARTLRRRAGGRRRPPRRARRRAVRAGRASSRRR